MTEIKILHRDSLSCESILRKAPNGDLIVIAQCGGTREPDIANRIFLFRSKDNGKTWDNGVDIYPMDCTAVYSTDVFVYDSTIYVFVTTHNGGFLNWRTFVLKSTDNGYTFTDGGEMPFFNEFTFFRNAIVTRENRIIIFYQHYPVTPEVNAKLLEEGKKVWHSRVSEVEIGVLVSDDGMKSFTKHRIDSFDITRSWCWAEGTMIERADGVISMLIRRDKAGCLFRADSTDGGLTWSKAYPSDIPNPGNKVKLFALSDGRIALAHTPTSLTELEDRHPMEIWVSFDNMKTWPYKSRLSDFPGIYSYPDGIVDDDGNTLIFTFDYNKHEIMYVRHTVEEKSAETVMEKAV